MTLISTINPRGIRPKVEPHLLDPNEASLAQNCKLESGALKPFDADSTILSLTDNLSYLTIHLYISSYWLAFQADVDIARGPIASDADARRYFTGEGIPKKFNEDEATTGVGDMPINFYPLAVPTPQNIIATSAGSGGSGDARDVAYLWTWRTAWGEEGKPSPASANISALNGQTINLSNMGIEWQAATDYTLEDWVEPSTLVDHVYKCVQAGTSGSGEPGTWGTAVDGDTDDGTCTWRCYKKEILYSGLAAKRIYRALSGETTISWKRVTSMDPADVIYADSTVDASLGSILKTEDWDPPPDDMRGIVSLGLFMAGFSGNTLCFCEPGYPHAWPLAYRKELDSALVAIGAKGNMVIAATDKIPAVYIGSTPGSMTPVKFSEPQPCIAKRGFVMFKDGAMWPTPAGLYFNTGTEGRLVTEKHFKKSDWDNYYPATLHAVNHGGQYVGFYSSGDNEGGLIVDFDNGIVMPLGFYATAAYADPKTGKLYYVKQAAEVRLLESGTAYPSRTNARLKEDGGYRLLEG